MQTELKSGGKTEKELKMETKEIKAKVTFLINRDISILEIFDDDSKITIARLEFSPYQIVQLLSRLGNTDVERCQICGFDIAGKNRLTDKIEIEIPKAVYDKHDEGTLYEYCKQFCPEGWEMSSYFGSKGSTRFDFIENKCYAVANLMKWVDKDEKEKTICDN